MSEEQTEYITEALELLQGVTTLEISSPEKVIERRDGQLVEVERSAFVKIYTSFKRELKTLSGDELKVWLYLALSINRYSKAANPGLRKIAEDTGLAVNTVRGIVERLESSHLLDVERAEGRGNQYRPADYASVSKFDTVPQTVSNSGPTVSNSGGTVSTLRGKNAQLEELDTTRVPDNYPIDWYIQHGLPIPPHLIDQNQMAQNAVNEFESKLGFSSLPWDSTAEWQKFKKWVIATYSGRLTAWEDYSDWRKAKGKYDAMSNKQIRMNPSVFMDTGWPSFLASSAMYDDGEKLRLL